MISRNRTWRYSLIHYRPDPDLYDLCNQRLLGLAIYPHESDRTARRSGIPTFSRTALERLPRRKAKFGTAIAPAFYLRTFKIASSMVSRSSLAGTEAKASDAWSTV
jgi:hypothetical protein